MALDVNGNIIDIKEELDFSLQSPSKSRHAQVFITILI
jgi:hypothetical protein